MTKRALPSSSFWEHLQVYGVNTVGKQTTVAAASGTKWAGSEEPPLTEKSEALIFRIATFSGRRVLNWPILFFKGFYFLFHICRGSVGGFESFERFGPRLSRASLLSQSLSVQIKDARGRMLLGWFLTREEGEVQMLSQDRELWSASSVAELFLYDSANLGMFQVQWGMHFSVRQ